MSAARKRWRTGLHLVEPEAEHDLVHEVLGGQVDDLLARAAREAAVADRLHEVRLAEARPAADEERVVLAGGLVGDAQRRGVREAVRGARHEVLERVRGVQAARPAARLGGDLLRVDRRAELAVGAEPDLARSRRPRGGPPRRSAGRRPPGCSRRRAASSPGRRSRRRSRTSAGSPGTRSRIPARPPGSSGARGSWPRSSLFPQDLHRCVNPFSGGGREPTTRSAGVQDPFG